MRKKIFSVVVSVLSIFGVLYFISSKAVIKETVCESQFGSCSEAISDLVDGYKGESYFSAKKVLAQELSVSSRIDNYEIRFNVPDKLVVEVVEKKPEVALKFGEGKYFLFDKEGNMVAEASETQLPLLTVESTPNDSAIAFAVKIFRDLFKYYDVREGKLAEFGLTASIRGIDMTFPLSGDVDVLLGSAEVALLQLPKLSENLTISAKTINSYAVDLRYKNPVISQK
jgi:cell division septal protein FtsQ